MQTFATTSLIILFLFSLPILGFSATFTAQADGGWSEPATWGETTLTPGATDDVIIDGFYVTVSVVVSAKNILVTNLSGLGVSYLEIRTGGNLTVSENLDVTSENMNQNVIFEILGWGEITVNGDVVFNRVNTNNHAGLLQLVMGGNGSFTANQSFEYSYKNANGESGDEIIFSSNSQLTVVGPAVINMEDGENFNIDLAGNSNLNFQNSLTINKSGGKIFNIDMNSLSLDIDGAFALINSGGDNLLFNLNSGLATFDSDFTMNSFSVNQKVIFNINSVNSTLDLNGNLNLRANDAGSVGLNLTDNSKLYIAGNIIRSGINSNGFISMDNTSNLYFDGISAQNIPETKILDAGTDSLGFSNIHFNNNSPEGMTLKGDLTILKNINLTDGLINTSDTAYLIIEDGATITGGSSSAYVNGPMIKRGRTGAGGFTFPIGDNGKYGALGIEEIRDAKVEYTVKYIGCPPPLGVRNNPIKHVNTFGYWEIERTDSDSLGDLTLHWDDADATGIDDVTSLVLSYYDPISGWYSMGESNATGGTGPGISGSISNAIGCPPPLGVKIVGFGSTDETKNALLPVDLTKFKAYKNNTNSKVFLEWETASERNSDYFVIEKSYDGISFSAMDRVQAAGNSASTRFYSSVDINPREGNNYYRIQQVDFDGMMDFSRLLNVFIYEQDIKPVVYPNPVKQHLNLYSKVLNHDDEVLIKVYDLNGTCVYAKNHRSQDGQFSLSTSAMNIREAGIYFINYRHNGIQYSQEFVKVND